MKDKREHQEHEKENQAHQGKQDPAKSNDHSKDAKPEAGSQSKQASSASELDHKQLGEFSKKMDADESMRSEFQVDPHGTLKKHGVALPEGYRASYDHQFVKSSDGADRVSHSYGPMRIEK